MNTEADGEKYTGNDPQQEQHTTTQWGQTTQGYVSTDSQNEERGLYKAGYLTTEFWLSLVTAALALAVNYDLVSQAQAEGWLQIGMVLISVLPTMVYTMSRTWLKK